MSETKLGRINERFATLKQQGKKALVAYLMGGDPNIEMTKAAIEHLVSIGVDVIEIGVPFSDPLADGPTIQAAGLRAMKTTLADLLDMVGCLRDRIDIPLLLMTYYNPVMHFGIEAFVARAVEVGLDGLIVPDLTPEEGGDLISTCKQGGVDPILLFAPTTSDKRMDYLCSEAQGFIYYVSRTGITGTRGDIAADLDANLERIRFRSDAPIAVGFGISNPQQALRVTQKADGAVIGSAIVKIMAEAGSDQEKMKVDMSSFLVPIIEGLHG